MHHNCNCFLFGTYKTAIVCGHFVNFLPTKLRPQFKNLGGHISSTCPLFPRILKNATKLRPWLKTLYLNGSLINGVTLYTEYCLFFVFLLLTRSDREFLYEILGEVIKAGATTLNIPDTVGITMPSEFGKLIADIKANTPGIENVIISTHCQNDLGLSTANTIEVWLKLCFTS